MATSFKKTTIMNLTLMKNLPALINSTALIILTWLACQIAPSARAASYNISMTAGGFVPSYLAVTVGDRVYWLNEDNTLMEDHSTVSCASQPVYVLALEMGNER